MPARSSNNSVSEHIDVHQGPVMPVPDDEPELQAGVVARSDAAPTATETDEVEAAPLPACEAPACEPSAGEAPANDHLTCEPPACEPSATEPQQVAPPDRVVATRLRVCFKSPGSEGEQEKDQDAFAVGPNGVWAAVADGVSSSPYGGEGARAAVDVVRDHFGADNALGVKALIDRVTEVLHGRRRDFIERPPKSNEKHHEAMRTYLEQIFRQKMEHSAQTTLALVLVTEERATIAVLGDSAVFVRACDQTKQDRFPPDARPRAPGCRTLVLPDHADRAIIDCLRLDRSFDLVLATDGFYHVFEDENAMFDWLSENESSLQCDGTTQRLGNAELDTWLHDTLRDARGDDDITAVWITIEVQDGRQSG